MCIRDSSRERGTDLGTCPRIVRLDLATVQSILESKAISVLQPHDDNSRMKTDVVFFGAHTSTTWPGRFKGFDFHGDGTGPRFHPLQPSGVRACTHSIPIMVRSSGDG